MTQNLGSGTARGLVDYLDSLVEKGRSRLGVVNPLKTALVKVLEKTEGDDWEKVDVIKLDVADAMTRFKNLTLGTYTDASYRAYELRTIRAIKWYSNFLANPGWFPKESVHNNGKTESNNSKVSNQPPYVSKTPQAASGASQRQNAENHSSYITPTEAPKIDAIAYPFPLESGETARVYIPKSITKADVKRLAVFLEALVIETEPK